MYRFLSIGIFIILLFNTTLQAQWPDNLEIAKKSMCLVEYYQPQSEARDIKDDIRIKRKISGILVTGSGTVITSDLIFPVNLDIVAGGNSFSNWQKPPEDITVSFTRGKKLKAKFIGKDEELRLAFIQITEPEQLPAAVKFGNKKHFKIGDPVYLVQHLDGRYDNELFVTTSFIGGILDRPQQKLLTEKSLQPLSPGGLVVDKNGTAVGVVSRSSLTAPDNSFEVGDIPVEWSLAEILPAYYFTDLIENPPRLVAQREGTGKSWLGIQMQIMTRDMADYWGLTGTHGIIISAVVPRSPAEKAKLQTGDIITSIGSFRIGSDDEKIVDAFRNYIRSLPEGEVTVNLIRDFQPLAINVNLESTPKSQFLADEFFDEKLGLSVKELTQDLILNYDLDFDIEGVWVSRVEEAGPAGLAGLEVNDLILNIDDTRIKNIADFREIIQNLETRKPEYIEVFVKRNQNTQFIFIKTGMERS